MSSNSRPQQNEVDVDEPIVTEHKIALKMLQILEAGRSDLSRDEIISLLRPFLHHIKGSLKIVI